MSEIRFNLPEPEEINRQITEAIAKSAIGEKLRDVINAEVVKLSQSYDNPIKKVVEDEIGKLLYQIVRDEYGEILKSKIRELLTEEIVNDITIRALDAWTSNKYR